MRTPTYTFALLAALMVVAIGCASASGEAAPTTGETPADASRGGPSGYRPFDPPGPDGREPIEPEPDDGSGPPGLLPDGAPTVERPVPRPPVAVSDLPTGVSPARVHIPAIEVDAEVVDLSLAGPRPQGPSDFAQVGWYVRTREPGEIGPAVLAGHVDSRDGPAVFFDLVDLRPGDLVSVTDDGGDERRFTVDALGQ